MSTTARCDVDMSEERSGTCRFSYVSSSFVEFVSEDLHVMFSKYVPIFFAIFAIGSSSATASVQPESIALENSGTVANTVIFAAAPLFDQFGANFLDELEPF